MSTFIRTAAKYVSKYGSAAASGDFLYNRKEDFYSEKKPEVFDVHPDSNINKNQYPNKQIFINGIKVNKTAAIKNAKILANLTNKTVTVVHNPSTGIFMYDLIRAGNRHLRARLHWDNKEDQVVAGLAKQLSQSIESQKKDSNYDLNLYAHSEGGMISEAAINRLTPEMQRNLRFVAFGSPYVDNDEELVNRINRVYVNNENDLVPKISSDKPKHVVNKEPKTNHIGIKEHEFEQYVDKKTLEECEAIFSNMIKTNKKAGNRT